MRICDGWPESGCVNTATHNLFDHHLCDTCARAFVSIGDDQSATIQQLRQQLASAHEAMGAARAVLHELDASGNYPHSSVAIGVVLMALEKATQ